MNRMRPCAKSCCGHDVMSEKPLLFRPLIIGLTGSIGMGKSTVAEMLREEGVPVFDADAEVHRLQAKGGACVAAIESAFPNTIGADGGIETRCAAVLAERHGSRLELGDDVGLGDRRHLARRLPAEHDCVRFILDETDTRYRHIRLSLPVPCCKRQPESAAHGTASSRHPSIDPAGGSAAAASAK